MHTYIRFWTLKISTLNMRFVDKRPSRMQGQPFFQSRAGWAAVFGLGSENFRKFLGNAPASSHLPLKAGRGRFNVPYDKG